LLYYMEYEDERKNPSWKRRMHRFYRSVSFKQLEYLNSMLFLSYLSYANNVEEVRTGLNNATTPYELVYVQLSSAPGQPASYVAVKRDQSSWSQELEVVIAVRGTKSAADAITDLLCDVVEYKEGQAHGYMVNSGRHIVKQHSPLLKQLAERAGKSRIKLTLVGHSLGAGAASIAGLEFKDMENYDVSVVGFGCPALFSLDLAEKSDFITTIINDSDVVPRASGITVANLIIDMMEFGKGFSTSSACWTELLYNFWLTRYSPPFRRLVKLCATRH
jgi:hypothetical protein